jgi:hypothetical protein
LQLRVHQFETLDSKNVECIYERELIISGDEAQLTDFQITTDDQHSYAVLGKLVEGNCLIHQLEIRSSTTAFSNKVLLQKSFQKKAVSLEKI